MSMSDRDGKIHVLSHTLQHGCGALESVRVNKLESCYLRRLTRIGDQTLVEKRITRDEVYVCNGAFVTGTAV